MGPIERLTAYQQRLAALVADAKSNKEIALELHTTVENVKHHLTRIYDALAPEGVRHSRLDVLLWWHKAGKFKKA